MGVAVLLPLLPLLARAATSDGNCTAVARTLKAAPSWCRLKGHHRTVPFLVTGAGRSGTHWASGMLQEASVDAPHEAVGTAGAVSWLLATSQAELSRGKSAHSVRFARVVQLVRHPLRAIATLARAQGPAEWSFVRRALPHIEWPESRLLQAAVLWVEWQRLVEPVADARLRLEDATLEDLCAATGAACRFSSGGAPRSATSASHYCGAGKNGAVHCGAKRHDPSAVVGKSKRPHVALTWAALRELDPVQYLEVRGLAESYGYCSDDGALGCVGPGGWQGR